jgi:hypothetical protein
MTPASAIGALHWAIVGAALQLALTLAVGRIGWTSGGNWLSQQAGPPDGGTGGDASSVWPPLDVPASAAPVGGGLASGMTGVLPELLEDPPPPAYPPPPEYPASPDDLEPEDPAPLDGAEPVVVPLPLDEAVATGRLPASSPAPEPSTSPPHDEAETIAAASAPAGVKYRRRCSVMQPDLASSVPSRWHAQSCAPRA